MKKSSSAIALQDKPIIVDELVDEGTYGRTELKKMRISPDNRKRFDQVKLVELAASIKKMGVAQPILIRPVTPTAEQPEEFEIVAGERRYRASIIAGLDFIPAMCRQLSDVDAAKLRIFENLHREDPHPIEEAEGFQILMLQHGYSADQLAEEIGKSRAYVYARLKLCALALDVRDQVLDGKVDASTALLVARIPVPALQVRAMAEILEGYNDQPMSYREAAAFTQERYMLDLKKAEFDRADGKLLARAGACSTCPKRAGNQPEVFIDVGADVCTDPDCFKDKKAAHLDRIVVESGNSSIPTFDDASALTAHDPNNSLVYVDDYLHRMQRLASQGNVWVPISSKLSSSEMPPAKAYLRGAGKLLVYCEKAAVQAALEKRGVCLSVEQLKEKAAAPTTTAPNAKRLAQMKAEEDVRRKKEATAAHETSFRVSLYKQFRERAKNGLSLQSLREFVKLVLIDDNYYSLPSDLLDVYGLESDSDEAVAAHIDQAGLPEVQLILIDLVLGDCLGVQANQVLDDGTINDDGYDATAGARIAALHTMASHEGIDPEAARVQFDLAALAIEEIDERYMHRFIRAYPERVNELTKSIVAERPHLLGALELAAKDCGFMYIDGTWAPATAATEPAPQAAPTDMTDNSALASAAQQPADADAAAVDGEDLEAAIAEPAPAKKSPKAKPAAKQIAVPSAAAARKQDAKPAKQVLAPAAAWPWPTSNTAALTPKASTASPEATQPAQEAK
jgi:ParB/RepB/Spo0J family partition protein